MTLKTITVTDLDGSDLTLSIPDSLPPLRRGLGSRPADGGCLMQVVNYLARGTWTDGHARNVAPMLAPVAIMVNDAVCDRHRQDLWAFMPRLIRTYETYESSPQLEWATIERTYEAYRGLALSPCPRCASDPFFVSFSSGTRTTCVCCDRCHALIRLLDTALTVFDDFTTRRRGHVERVNWRVMTHDELRGSDRHLVTAMATMPPHLIDEMMRTNDNAIKLALHAAPPQSYAPVGVNISAGAYHQGLWTSGVVTTGKVGAKKIVEMALAP